MCRLRDIKEDVNDYIENSQEPDFVENEYIYDDIEGLEDMLLDVSITKIVWGAGLWIWGRAVDLDPHSFLLLDPDPDPGGKIFQIKTKNERKLVITSSSFNFSK